MASCSSPAPLHSLSSHLFGQSKLGQESVRCAAFNSPPTSEPAASSSSSFGSTFRTMSAPRSSAPYHFPDTFASTFTSTPDTTAYTSFPSEADAQDLSPSPAYNPESFTAQHATPSWASQYLGSTPGTSSPAAYASTLPTPDEAAELAYSTPPYSQKHEHEQQHASPWSSEFHQGGGGSPAHPLTMEPTLDAAWDYDRLFSRRRRWFGGERVFGAVDDTVRANGGGEGDGNEQEENRGDNERSGRTTHRGAPGSSGRARSTAQIGGRVRGRSGLREELCLSEEKVADEVQEIDMDKQRLDVYERLRNKAAKRMQMVAEHIGESGAGSGI